jgi:ribose 5-phosphate isomerase B
MKVGLAADHGGFELKQVVYHYLIQQGHQVIDYGADHLVNTDDYPDYIIPMAKAVAAFQVERGIAICGSGVGASIAANKVKGVRAALVNDHFSAHQGVEDDDMNILCMGGRIIGPAAALELVNAFLQAIFIGAERHVRRLSKVIELEHE